jgi:hypothetical protein
MPKTRSNLFNLILQGNATMTSELWVDLGVIPTGSQIMLGYATYTPDGKTITFDLRSNTVGNSTGTTGTTTLHDRVTVRDLNNAQRDYYQNGRLQTLTVQSTGVEKLWIRLTSKSNAAADAYWWIYYTIL